MSKNADKEKLNKNKPWAKVAGRIFVLLMTLVIIFTVLTRLAFYLNEKGCYGGKVTFYKSDIDYEVLFFGTSHIYNGVYCMELYRDYGIWSYNLGEPGERMPMTYWAVRDAIKAHKPRLVVLDAYSLESKNQKNDPKSTKRCHYTFDGMPFSKNKIDGVMDTIEKDDWLEFLFPLSIYHGRWAGLEEKDFTMNTFRDNANGSAYINTIAGSVSGPNLIGQGKYEWVDDNATLYMQKVIDECKAQGIEVLILNMPFNAIEENQQRTGLAYAIAEKNSITYLDLLYYTESMGFDYSLDDADGISHINPMGARKVTDYVGDYLVGNYDLTDYRTTELSQKMYEKYAQYCIKAKDVAIRNAKDYKAYMTLLADTDYKSVVTIKSKAAEDDHILMGILRYGEALGCIEIEYAVNSGTQKTSEAEDGEIMSEAEEGLMLENGETESEESHSENTDLSVVVVDAVTGGEIDSRSFSINE